MKSKCTQNINMHYACYLHNKDLPAILFAVFFIPKDIEKKTEKSNKHLM